MKNNQWLIVLKNSICGSQFVDPIHRAFRTRLDVKDAQLEMIEHDTPITLESIARVIPLSKINSVILDTRHDGPKLPMACGVKMTCTKGALFEVEFNSEHDPGVQAREFDTYVRMSQCC